MSNMRDQLKKAKLLDEKNARRLAHEERVQRTELGRAGVEKLQQEREASLLQLREAERERNQRMAEAAEAARKLEAERTACADLLANEVVKPGRGGGFRFHFQLADGQLPWVELNEGEQRKLAAGAFVLVRTGPPDSHAYGLLPAVHVPRLRQVFPERIAWPARFAAVAPEPSNARRRDDTSRA